MRPVRGRCARRDVQSADADELAPDGGKAGADQHDRGTVAEHAAHAAHVGAIGPELAVTGCVKDAGQDQQHYSSKIHRGSPLTGGVRLNDFASLSFEEKSSARSTRRANQRHPAIIAKIVRPVPETGGGLFLWLDASERLLQF